MHVGGKETIQQLRQGSRRRVTRVLWLQVTSPVVLRFFSEVEGNLPAALAASSLCLGFAVQVFQPEFCCIVG